MPSTNPQVPNPYGSQFQPQRYSNDYFRYMQSGQPFNQPVMGYGTYGQIFTPPPPRNPPPIMGGKGGGMGYRPAPPPIMGGKGGGMGYDASQMYPQSSMTMGGFGQRNQFFPERRTQQLGLTQRQRNEPNVPATAIRPEITGVKVGSSDQAQQNLLAQPSAPVQKFINGVPIPMGSATQSTPTTQQATAVTGNNQNFNDRVFAGGSQSFYDRMEQLRNQSGNNFISADTQPPTQTTPQYEEYQVGDMVIRNPVFTNPATSTAATATPATTANTQNYIPGQVSYTPGMFNLGDFGRTMQFQEGGQVPPDAATNMEMMLSEVGPANPQAEMSGEYDRLIQMTMQAVLGQIEQPDEIIQMFIEEFGVDAFRQLRDAVLKQQVPNAQTEGMVDGNGGGMDDQVMGMIGAQRPVAVSPGEYIIPADVVSGLGDGSSKSGADILDELGQAVRMARTGTPEQPRPLMETLSQ